MRRTKLFHRTTAKNAYVILMSGFKDGRGSVNGRRYCGVWLSRRPYPASEGFGRALLEVTFPISSAEIANYTWFNDSFRASEMCVPASRLNQHGSIRLVEIAP
jgi:hypothetical protein